MVSSAALWRGFGHDLSYREPGSQKKIDARDESDHVRRSEGELERQAERSEAGRRCQSDRVRQLREVTVEAEGERDESFRGGSPVNNMVGGRSVRTRVHLTELI